jgi:CHAT domain-containing protein
MSGLGFAGANRGASPGGGAGILTALTASELDLRGVELLTLAECETGLGKVADGEGGVLGLQRAFQLAGARTVVASYWRIGDRATREFVVEFYRNLWDRKLSKVEAFRQVQLRMIERYTPSPAERVRGPVERPGKPIDPGSARPFAAGDELPPFFWSGFALSGDWR